LGAFLRGSMLLQRADRHDDAAAAREAVELLYSACLTAPTRALFQFELAHAAQQARDAATARRCARTLELQWPDSGTAWGWIGMALMDVDPEASVIAFRKSIALLPDRSIELKTANCNDPSRAAVYGNLGRTLRNLGRLDEALPFALKSVEY